LEEELSGLLSVQRLTWTISECPSVNTTTISHQPQQFSLQYKTQHKLTKLRKSSPIHHILRCVVPLHQ